MSLVLNKKNVEALVWDGKERSYVDTHLQGFGIRIGRKTKSWYIEKRVNGKPKKKTIGRFPIMSPEEARKTALHGLAQLSRGEMITEINNDGTLPSNPEHHPLLHEHKKPSQTSQQSFQAQAKALTLLKVQNDYINANQANRAPKTLKRYRDCLRIYFPEWTHLPLNSITEDMVLESYLKGIQRAPQGASSAFGQLRTLFNFAMRKYRFQDPNLPLQITHKGEYLISSNPVTVLSKEGIWVPKKRRRTIIPKKKLGTWFQALQHIKQETSNEAKKTCCDYLTTLLLLGLRRTEAAKIEWSHVDLELGTITLIEENTKTRSQHVLPLSNYLWC